MRWARAAVPAGALLLAVTACGTPGGTFAPAGDAAGAPQGRPGSTAGAGEKAEVAPGLTLVYADPVPGDAARAALIKSVRAYLMARYRAIATGGSDKEYEDVAVARGRLSLRKSINEYVKRGDSIQGTIRIHSAKIVSVWEEKGAQVDVCVDETSTKLINAKSGRQRAGNGNGVRFWRQTVGLRRIDEGWRASDLRWAPSAKECR